MVEAVMEEHEIKQLNDYAMTKWVNEMQIRNSDPARRRRPSWSAVQYLRTRRVLQPLPFGELPVPVLRAARPALDGLSRSFPDFHLPGRHRAHPGQHQRQLQARRDLQHRRRGQQHSIEELSDIVLKVSGAVRGPRGAPRLRDPHHAGEARRHLQVGSRPRPQEHLRPRGRHEAHGGLDAECATVVCAAARALCASCM